MEFRTVITDISIYNINKYLNIPNDICVDFESKTATIEYEFQFEDRSWGLKYIAINYKKVVCKIEWFVDCFKMDAEKIALLVKAGGIESGSGYNHMVAGSFSLTDLNIVNEVEFKPDGMFYISEADIDLSKNSIVLS